MHCTNSQLWLQDAGRKKGIIAVWSVLENYNDNNNNGLLTVYPPGGSSPVKNYNIKRMKNYNVLQKKTIEIYNMKSNNIGL